MEKKRKSTCLLLILSLVLLFTSFDSPRVLAADDLIFSCHIITKEESRDNQEVMLSSFCSANSKIDRELLDKQLSLLSSYKDSQVTKDKHNDQVMNTPKVEALSIASSLIGGKQSTGVRTTQFETDYVLSQHLKKVKSESKSIPTDTLLFIINAYDGDEQLLQESIDLALDLLQHYAHAVEARIVKF